MPQHCKTALAVIAALAALFVLVLKRDLAEARLDAGPLAANSFRAHRRTISRSGPQSALLGGVGAPIEILRPLDGETVLAVVPIEIRVKLVAAEVLRDRDLAARACLKSVHFGRIWFPGNASEFLDEVRGGTVYGEIWLDGQADSLSKRLIDAGFAKRRKVPGAVDYDRRPP